MSDLPWLASYPRDISWGDPLPPLHRVEDFLHAAAEKWPQRTALDFYDSTLSFSELRDRSRIVAAHFRVLGIVPGDRIALHLSNTPHFVICFFAALMAGAVCVPIGPSAAPMELRQRMKDAGAKLLVSMAHFPAAPSAAVDAGIENMILCDYRDFLDAVRAQALCKRDATTLGLGPEAPSSAKPRTLLFAEILADTAAVEVPPVADGAEALAVLQYTGGTTGEPKAAMLTHANFVASIHSLLRWERPNDSQADKRLVMVPLSHIFGLTHLVVHSVATGTQVILCAWFNPAEAIRLIAEKQVTLLAAVPSMYAALVGMSGLTRESVASLRYCSTGGAQLPLELFEKFRARTGLSLLEGYGLTETSALSTMQFIGSPPRPGTVGVPQPHTVVQIVDLKDGTTELPVGAVGEVCISGPQVMKGYWNRPDETGKVLRNGRLHTGDIGFLDRAGYLTLVDRLKEMFISGGINVYPRKVETAIYQYDRIVEALVIGVPDSLLGQRVKAFVVLKEGQDLDREELRRFLTARLSRHEMPMEIVVRDALPKTAVGKLSKRLLVEEEDRQRAMS